MYHSVGVVDPRWHWNYLTCPYQKFESQLKWLKKFGFVTLSLYDLYNYMNYDKKVPKNSVILTFDDGYLDNFVFAYPLLKKYGFCGTIFVNPDFIDKREIIRNTIHCLQKDTVFVDTLEYEGFASWAELKKVDDEKILDVQSHAKTHTWYPVSEKIIDFRNPNDKYIWIDWNNNEDHKPELHYLNPNLRRLGEPVFEYKESLSAPKIEIKKEFIDSIVLYVQENGGSSFFKNDNWRAKLFKYSELKREEFISIVEKKESWDDYLNRIRFELEYSKSTIEQNLCKKVDFLCWPNGSGTKHGVRIAKELGFKMTTAARDIPFERKKLTNSPEYKSDRIARITPTLLSSGHFDSDNKIYYSFFLFFIFQLFTFQRRFLAHLWFDYTLEILRRIYRWLQQ